MRWSALGVALFFAVAPAASAATGGQLWARAGCGGCHTLGAAGSYGNGGPNLDQLQPSAAAVAAQVASGGGGMPSFGGSLSTAQIAALAAYVSSAAAGGGSAPSSSQASPAAAAPPPSRPAVRAIQHSLSRLGYFNGPFTGVYGPLTTAAVQSFQRSAGLAADGIWGPATKAALSRAESGRAGASSASGLPAPKAWVKRLQVDLGTLGFFNGPDTGVYGPLTTAAVKSFQAASGLAVDGRWGPRSQSALVRRLG
jgi:peptidoglycan hydrolase-like protein with peptidoglycan-binding domain